MRNFEIKFAVSVMLVVIILTFLPRGPYLLEYGPSLRCMLKQSEKCAFITGRATTMGELSHVLRVDEKRLRQLNPNVPRIIRPDSCLIITGEAHDSAQEAPSGSIKPIRRGLQPK